MRIAIGPKANNGKPACSVTLTIHGRTFQVGAWAYGWENLAYYRRFDHVRFVARTWNNELASKYLGPQWQRDGDGFKKVKYPGMARGFDKTVVIRDDGEWLQRPRMHR